MLGKINYVYGMFLGKEELLKEQGFHADAVKSSILRSKDWGIFDLSKKCVVFVENNDKLVLKSNSSKFLAGYDIDGNAIVVSDEAESRIQIQLTQEGTFDVMLKAAVHHFEKGRVTIDASGYVTGENTEFTKLFRNAARGRYSRFKVEEGAVYLVQNVINDTTMQVLTTNDTAFQTVASRFQILPTLTTFISEGAGVDSLLYDYMTSELTLASEGAGVDDGRSFKLGTAAVTIANGVYVVNFEWGQKDSSKLD